jgi:hypothetical protein
MYALGLILKLGFLDDVVCVCQRLSGRKRLASSLIRRQYTPFAFKGTERVVRDLQVEIPLPNEHSRLDILKIHASKITKHGDIGTSHNTHLLINRFSIAVTVMG